MDNFFEDTIPYYLKDNAVLYLSNTFEALKKVRETKLKN